MHFLVCLFTASDAETTVSLNQAQPKHPKTSPGQMTRRRKEKGDHIFWPRNTFYFLIHQALCYYCIAGDSSQCFFCVQHFISHSFTHKGIVFNLKLLFCKTKVWEEDVSFYILVAFYPTEGIQAFLLHDSRQKLHFLLHPSFIFTLTSHWRHSQSLSVKPRHQLTDIYFMFS